MKKLLIVFALASCITKVFYIEVPYDYKRYLTYPIHWFSCSDCGANYDSLFSNYISENKVIWNPLDSEEAVDKVLLEKIHNTMMKIGYDRIFSREFYNNNIKVFVDSLRFWQFRETNRQSYYSMFIYRRELQGTKELVMSIISDVADVFQGEIPVIKNEFVNDTVVKMAGYDLQLKSGRTDKHFLLGIFDYLKSIGQYHMAYELTYKPVDFATIDLSRDSLLLTMPLDTVKKSVYCGASMRLGSFKNGKWEDEYMMWKSYPGP